MVATSGLFSLLALMGGGGDLVSALPAKDYFEYRQIEPTIDKLVELAATEPTTGKAQLAQLFALKMLASDVAALKKSPKLAEHLLMLKEIADGKKAADKCGFAAEFAGRALTAHGRTKTLLAPRGNWRQGAAWIPGSVTFLAGFDTKDRKADGPAGPDYTEIVRQLPKEMKEPMFAEIEKLGNVRLDRLVMGMAPMGNNMEIFVRMTGKANPKWITNLFGDSMTMTEQSIAGREVRLLESRGNDQPSVALIDDTEMLVAGPAIFETRKPRPGEKAEPAPKRTAQVEKMLALVRGGSGAGPSAMTGNLKAELAKVPIEAGLVAVGTIPAPMKMGSPFPMPDKILAHGVRSAGGIALHVSATMSGENEAKQFAQTINDGRDAGLKQIGQMAGKAPPGLNPAAIGVMLQSIQVTSEG
ncbi:MAG TPA: hypothetical protein VHR72_02985, partial [Gemmataceae bacterium]|nr:hypothetical protein [Gemmataceae bacterium]